MDAHTRCSHYNTLNNIKMRLQFAVRHINNVRK